LQPRILCCIFLLGCLLQESLARIQGAEPDNGGIAIRAKRYALPHASKWSPDHLKGHKLSLAWFVSKYSKHMDKKETRNAVPKCFEIWANQTNIPQLPKDQQVILHFEEAKSESEADINIRFEEGEHGDKFPFDGEGDEYENVLAHIFFPDYKPFPFNGDIHLDDSQKWTLGTADHSFQSILTHEISHSLGLQHSHARMAVASAHYKYTETLHTDDKCALNWNIVGPSNWCLLVYLTSEIFPIDNYKLDMNKQETPKEKLVAVKRQLQNMGIPTCNDDNKNESDLHILLQKNLHLSESDAAVYRKISCDILSGLVKYQADSTRFVTRPILYRLFWIAANADKLKDQIGKTEMSRRRNLHRFIVEKPSSLSSELYNEEFFDAFFMEY
ncbi:hypothetical protein PFISCL1PPCAC_9532, partial [Pristionchus fissidentatus]